MNETLKNILIIGIFTSTIIGGIVATSMHMDKVYAKEKQEKIDANDPVKVAMKQKEQEEFNKKQEAMKSLVEKQARMDEAKYYLNKKYVFIDSNTMTESGKLDMNIINRGNKKVTKIIFEIEVHSRSGAYLETKRISTTDKNCFQYGTGKYGGFYGFTGIRSQEAELLNFRVGFKYGSASSGSYNVSIVNIELE